MSHMLYFSYPLDQTDGNAQFLQLVDQVKIAIQRSTDFGAMFDPGDAFAIANVRRHGVMNPAIAAINALALDRADTVVAFLPAGVASVGVPMEIDRAVSAGKLVFILTDLEVSFMLNYNQPNVIRLPLEESSAMAIVHQMPGLWSTVMAEWDMTERPEYLPVKLLDSDAKLPTRAYYDDTGFDLYTIGEHVIEPGSWLDIPTGIAVELPSNIWAMLTGRSSTWRNLRLNVIQGIIDPGYRGPLFVGVHNPTELPITIVHGTRLAQLILMGNYTREFAAIEVQELNPSLRGTQGFGSSGSGL